MRSKTLGFLYFIKYIELFSLTALTAVIMIQGFTLIQELPTFEVIIQEKNLLSKKNAELRDEPMLSSETMEGQSSLLPQILIGISMVIVLFTLLHNNLLTNIRFYSKMRCVTCGLCTYDAVNFAICHCFLHKVCRDQFPKPVTLVKFFVSLVVVGFTSWTVWTNVDYIAGQVFDVDGDAQTISNLHIYFILWILHPLIFLIARPILFIVLSILCCCCSNGDLVNEDNELKDKILSFDFIQFELGELNNFEDHAIGMQEVAFNRNLEFVRQQTLRIRREANENNEMKRSSIQRLGDGLRKTVVLKLGVSRRGAECPICYVSFEDGDKVQQLTCHETHQLHNDCYDNFVKYNEENRHTLSCPMCRKKIDKAHVTKKEIHFTKDHDDDPFALKNPNAIDPKHKGQEDAVELSGLPSPEVSLQAPGLVNPPHGEALAPVQAPGNEAPQPEVYQIDD